MEQKKVNLSLLFSLIIFAIGVSIKGLVGFFGGSVGIPFVATLVMFSLAYIFGLSKVENRKRVVDVLVLDIVALFFCLVMYCAIDWSLEPSVDLYNFATVWSNVYSILSLFLFGYCLFRVLSERAGCRFKAVEVILGNVKIERTVNQKEKPVKNLKEVKNGDLEDKPSNDNSIEQNGDLDKNDVAEISNTQSSEQVDE